MQLLQIKLSGFKTFPDNTLININSNLVAIVGPNGCGKSNIIDAIRWVLGESSSKQLRADAMTDVVFNGSKYRKKASRASVSLTFSNHQHKLDGLWNTYDEIIIKRTISHDGDSEYFINNKLVRRRDITNLFLGTGLNASNKSYAIIEQGMVTKITSAKPEELKLYLEEVSGVSKYRDKRRDTIAQLSSVDLNLTRLMDLKQELELQINNLILDAQSAHQYNQLYQQKQQKELLRCMLFIYFYNNQIKQINLELITHKLTYNLTIENIQTLKSEQIVNENNLHQANLELENLNTEDRKSVV